MNTFKFLGILALLSLFTFKNGLAQNTGKISGKVYDSQTGESLPGANVIIPSTHMGASTNANGRYFILQLKPGSYEIKVSFVGYHDKIIKGIKVDPGVTAHIDVKLDPKSIQSKEIVVRAHQSMVQKDVTSSESFHTSTEMQQIAGIENTNDVFKLQGGVVQGGPQQQ
ncbi:MAG TPA: carboxypeptidase-like regulatory domain-containing protein, partial [Balneolales bacterium]|nr:carboxypeptidase-like regulatory domain-containing protein [Balneolales bacterium]